MVKKIFFIVVMFVSVLFCQRHSSGQGPFTFMHTEYHLFPAKGFYILYYSYRIPYNRLVFLKNGENYDSEFRILIEATDTNSNFIDRQIKQQTISLNDFKLTNSSKHFAQGVITFKFKSGIYKMLPIITDLNSKREVKLKPLTVKVDKNTDGGLLLPVIVNDKEAKCDNSIFPVLTNYDGNIPFDDEKYNILFPLADISIDTLNIQIVNNKDTVYTGELVNPQMMKPAFTECDGNIILKASALDDDCKVFSLNGLSPKFMEGNLSIKVWGRHNPKDEKKFNKTVNWYNKPFSLSDPESAIKALKFMESDSVISELLKGSEKKYSEKLFNYWKKFDPTPETAYNELMNEYYQRIDYAVKNFSTITGKNGMASDRGMIYIKFGKPLNIERTSDNDGRVVETWIYKNPARTFTFVDKQGTGDFSLRKS